MAGSHRLWSPRGGDGVPVVAAPGLVRGKLSGGHLRLHGLQPVLPRLGPGLGDGHLLLRRSLWWTSSTEAQPVLRHFRAPACGAPGLASVSVQLS